MELGLVRLVGMVMSKGVSRGGCQLNMTLGSLSADGCVCVPTLLVVWPEASQNQNLRSVGLDQVSVPQRWTSWRAHSANIPWGKCHWGPFPHSPMPLSLSACWILPPLYGDVQRWQLMQTFGIMEVVSSINSPHVSRTARAVIGANFYVS